MDENEFRAEETEPVMGTAEYFSPETDRDVYELEVTVEEPEKPRARKAVNHVFLWLLIYNLLIMVLAIPVNRLGADIGVSSLVPALIAAGFVYLCTYKKWPVNPFESRRKMTGFRFLEYFCILCTTQVLTAVTMYAVESSGVSGTSIDVDMTSLSMIIYAGFTGPFCEEIMYRGFAAGKLRKYGRLFAIVLSALAFGLMHMNASQFLIGFLTGLLLGYVFVEYSIVWTLVLHIVNNFGLTILPGLLLPNAKPELVNGISNSFVGVGALLGIYFLIKERRAIADYVRNPGNRAERGAWKDALTSIWFWIFAFIYLFFIVFLMTNPDMSALVASAA